MKSRHIGRYAVGTAVILAIGVPSVAAGFGEGRDTHLGKRNPSSSALSSETQIIANNGTYGTRQSNKRDGDGGGAIYGCRSSAGHEPCVRANNLKGGRAFEFATIGKEAGLIQVGDTTSPPFVTNAAGKVQNLNADKLDDRDSSDFASAGDLGFASVKADGTFVAGRGATASAKSVPTANTYVVTFNKDVSKCSFTANVVGASSDGALGVQAGPQPTQVTVDEPDTAGPSGAGRDFHLQAIC